VKEGKVTVNGDKIFEPGYKVSGKDKVVVKGKQVFLQKTRYISYSISLRILSPRLVIRRVVKP